MTPDSPLPLRRRPLDLTLAALFGVFFLTSVLFDALTAFDVDLAAGGSPFIDASYAFARDVDPLLLRPPLALQVMCGISAFVFGPFYLVLIYAFVRGRDWIRVPAIMYATAILYSMVVVLAVELLGEVNPIRPLLLALAYAPYVLVPAALLWRVRRPRPFTAS